METLSRKEFDKEFRKVWKETTGVEIGEGFNEKGDEIWIGVKLNEKGKKALLRKNLINKAVKMLEKEE